MPGVWMAHAMFGERFFMVSQHVRSGTAQWFGEFIAKLRLARGDHRVLAPTLGSGSGRRGGKVYATARLRGLKTWAEQGDATGDVSVS